MTEQERKNKRILKETLKDSIATIISGIIIITAAVFLLFYTASEEKNLHNEMKHISEDINDLGKSHIVIISNGKKYKSLYEEKFYLDIKNINSNDRKHIKINAVLNTKGNDIVDCYYQKSNDTYYTRTDILKRGALEFTNKKWKQVGIDNLYEMIGKDHLSITGEELKSLNSGQKPADYDGYIRAFFSVWEKYQDKITIPKSSLLSENGIERMEWNNRTGKKVFEKFWKEVKKSGILTSLKREVKERYGEKDSFYELLKQWEKKDPSPDFISFCINNNSLLLEWHENGTKYQITADYSSATEKEQSSIDKYQINEKSVKSYTEFFKTLKKKRITLNKYTYQFLFFR